MKRHGAEEVNSNEGAGATSSKRGAVAYGNSWLLIYLNLLLEYFFRNGCTCNLFDKFCHKIYSLGHFCWLRI